MALNDKTSSVLPIQFVKHSGGEQYTLIGNRVMLEDGNGNAMNMASGMPMSSPVIQALLTQIAALLAGTLTANIGTMPSITVTGLPLQANVFKFITTLDISSEATIWTPASGKKFRLMGGILTVTGAAGNVVFKDGNSGSTILTLPNSLVGTPIPLNMGDGILSTTANNNLRGSGGSLQLLNGTVFGREE